MAMIGDFVTVTRYVFEGSPSSLVKIEVAELYCGKSYLPLTVSHSNIQGVFYT